MHTLVLGRELTDKQWELVAAILPADSVRPDRKGQPWSDRCTVFNGVLWILCTGAPCPTETARTRPSIGASSTGCARACSEKISWP